MKGGKVKRDYLRKRRGVLCVDVVVCGCVGDPVW